MHCAMKLIVYNDFECYDEDEHPAKWVEFHKDWVCQDCWEELPDHIKEL